ncbi:MAG: antitoxin [Ideonella sp. MAG2]|nr:MAG: antitoxin [Ideonella sp. MAG2]
MRTTLDIADDVLLAAKARAAREKKSLGQVISELARQAFQNPTVPSAVHAAEPLAAYGICPLPSRGSPVTTDLVQRLQDHEGQG